MLLRQLLRNSLVVCRPNFLRKPQLSYSVQVNHSTLQPYAASSNESDSSETGRTFIQRENVYAYRIVSKGNIKSTTTTSKEITDDASFTNYLNKNWRETSPVEIAQAFSAVKQFCIENNVTISDNRFDKLVDGLMDHCERLTDRQLYNLLRDLADYPLCNGYAAPNYHDVWSCLDDICCWKMHNWDVNTLFAFGDLWFRLHLGTIADFVFLVLDKLIKKADTLTKDQLAHIFFFYNVCRRRSVEFEYEHALQHKVQEMNIDELAVVALGYFKTSSKIKLDGVIRAMIDGVTRSTMGIHEISLGAIMKTLRLSCPIKFTNEIKEMLDALLPELDRFSELACLHVALVATSVQAFHPAVLRKCSQNLVSNFSNLRLKDIERCLNVLTMFSFDPKTVPDVFEVAFQELHKDHRIPEIIKFPTCLPAALHYFSLKNKYSYDLMNRVLDMDFIHSTYGRVKGIVPVQIFSLDVCVDIDCPDYSGNRLPPLVRYKAAKWHTAWPPTIHQHKKLSVKDLLLLQIIDICKKILPTEDCILIQHVLPHFPTAEIILCKDLNTQAFIKPELSHYQLGDVMKVNSESEGKKWYSVISLTWNNVIRETSVPLGHTAMQIRQLEAIGYVPVPIISHQFAILSPEEKEQFILNKLS